MCKVEEHVLGQMCVRRVNALTGIPKKRRQDEYRLLTVVCRHFVPRYCSGVNLDTAVRFADLDFLLECKISAIWRRFPLIFAFYILNVRHISTSGFLTY